MTNTDDCNECPIVLQSSKLIEAFTIAVASFNKLYELFRLSLLALIIISLGKSLADILVGFIK